MKIVVIMCVEEYADKARKLLRDSNISTFSEGDIRGYHLTKNISTDNWFADKHSPENSNFFFTMCDENKANELLNAIKQCKVEIENEHVHAFQLNIEKFIN